MKVINNIKDFKEEQKDNILLFTYAENGAMGWSNRINILTKDCEEFLCYKIDFEEDIKEEFYKIIPWFKGLQYYYSRANESLNNGWQHIYTGHGNHLYLKAEIFNKHKSEILSKTQRDLYVNLHDFLKD